MLINTVDSCGVGVNSKRKGPPLVKARTFVPVMPNQVIAIDLFIILDHILLPSHKDKIG